MVQVSYPGVYVQEISSGVRTITGVATSVAAFFGRASTGPVDRAVRCLSYADFERTFGRPHPMSELAASVRLFFDNGGTDCYVVRLANGAQAAGITLRNGTGGGSRDVLIATAKMQGLWGNGLRLEVDYNTPNPGETFNLRIFREEGGQVIGQETHANLSMDVSSNRFAPTFVTQSSALIDLHLDTSATGVGDPTVASSTYNTGTFAGISQGRRPVGVTGADIVATLNGLITPAVPNIPRTSFEISVNGSAYQTVVLSALDPVAITTHAQAANVIQTATNSALGSLVPAPTVTVAFQQMGAAGTPRLLTFTADAPQNGGVRIRRAPANDIAAALMLGSDNGGVEIARFSNFRPVPTGSVYLINVGDDLARLNLIALLNQNQLNGIVVDGVSIPLPLQTGPNATDSWFLDAIPGDSPNGHNDGVREKLRLMAEAITNSATSRYRGELHGYYLAIIPKDGPINQMPTVVHNPSGDGRTAFDGALNRNVRRYTLGPGTPPTFADNIVVGDDGGVPRFADYVGSDISQTGFHALDTADLFNLMVLPADRELPDAQRQQLWGPASVYCQSRRAFLLMDAPDGWTNNGLAAIVQNSPTVNNLRATVVKDHSAVYYPKIRINDRGSITSVNPSGAIAGLMSRIDATRGVWKAPAGTEADLRNVVGLDVKLTDRENGVLNKLGVNCLRSFPSGFNSWGARTMDGSDDLGSEWKYVPIRRLALFIEESLFRGTQWVVFEPNDEPLWAKIRLNVGVFMNGLFRQGAFQGSTPNEAFFVKCDKDTTTQADRNLGIVNILVGFAPLKPAEFVIITIQQIAGDLS